MALYSDLNQKTANVPPYKALVTDIDSIKQSIVNILKTSRGERLFNPEFGNDLDSILFDPVTKASESLIFSEIYDSIRDVDSRVVVNNAKTRITAIPEKNLYNVRIVFNVVGLGEQDFEVIRELEAGE